MQKISLEIVDLISDMNTIEKVGILEMVKHTAISSGYTE